MFAQARCRKVSTQSYQLCPVTKLTSINSLRKSPKALAALREKLFLLWGDLEERKARKASSLKEVGGNARLPFKQEKPQSKPFQCCLKEYGVRKRSQRGIGIVKGIGGDKCAGEEENWEWERKWKMFGTTII